MSKLCEVEQFAVSLLEITTTSAYIALLEFLSKSENLRHRKSAMISVKIIALP